MTVFGDFASAFDGLTREEIVKRLNADKKTLM